MNDKQILQFVTCPNPDHVNQEGWTSRQIYYAGNGIYKCNSCGKEFTREEIRKEIEKDYALMIRDLQRDYQQNLANLQRDYQQNLAKLYADKKENLDVIDAG